MTPHIAFDVYHQTCEREEFQACVVCVSVGGHRLCQVAQDCIVYRDGSVRLWSSVRWRRGGPWWHSVSDPFRSCIKTKN